MQQKYSSYIAIVLAVVALGVVFLGRAGQATQTENTLATVLKTGKIVACTVVDPPFIVKDSQTDVFSGPLIDAMNVIAKKLNATIAWQESTWGNATADLASRRCDVVVAPFFANIGRAQAVAFTSPPLGYMGLGAVVRKDDTRFSNVKSVFGFDKPNITVVTATGEVGDTFVKENFKQAKVREIDVEAGDLTRFITEVSTGRADVAIAGSDTAAIYTAAHPEVVDLFQNDPFGLSPVGWAVRQDDIEWLNFLNTSLQYLDTQGTLSSLEKQYDVHLVHEVKQYQVQ